MTSSPALVRGARAAIGLAVRALPTRADRSRYLDEFIGDLHGLPAGAQLRYVGGVLSQAWSLRAALLSDPSRATAPLTPRARWRSLRCHVLRIHYWKVFSTDDGSRYAACAVCRKEHHPGGGISGPGSFAAMDPGM
jgi:hypothetical protein